MIRGQAFEVKAYELVASAQACEGGGPPQSQEVILVHNNSSHYILAEREPGRPIAYFIESEYYNTDRYTDDDTGLAYARMLTRMVALALSR